MTEQSKKKQPVPEAGVKVYTCTVCGDTKKEEIPATGHVWDEGKVTTEATTEAEGVKTYTCTICGDTKTEAIPKLDDNDNKGDTDDDNNGKTDVSIDVVAGENTPAVAVEGTTDDIVKKDFDTGRTKVCGQWCKDSDISSYSRYYRNRFRYREGTDSKEVIRRTECRNVS